VQCGGFVVVGKVMANNLQAAVRQLAETFAQGVLDAIRSSSLEELLNKTGSAAAPARRGPGRPRKNAAPAAGPAPKKRGRPAKSNGGNADATIERIVALLQKKPKGLRSEDLRRQLKLDKPVLQRATTKALAAHLITKTGEKRATTYFAK
jgi:hypothetical protein